MDTLLDKPRRPTRTNVVEMFRSKHERVPFEDDRLMFLVEHRRRSRLHLVPEAEVPSKKRNHRQRVVPTPTNDLRHLPDRQVPRRNDVVREPVSTKSPVKRSVPSVPTMSNRTNACTASSTTVTTCCKFHLFHPRPSTTSFRSVVTNVLFPGNVRNIVMQSQKGKMGSDERDSRHGHRWFSCPVCKVRSAFITPSKHWYENKDEKTRLVKKHKGHLK